MSRPLITHLFGQFLWLPARSKDITTTTQRESQHDYSTFSFDLLVIPYIYSDIFSVEAI
jgi:hypothetical protein